MTNSLQDTAPQREALQSMITSRYRILQLLGKGSQGAVYLAKSESTHQKIAIKQLHIASVKDWKQYDLFQREANVLKGLDIPGVAKLHETIEILDAETPMALIVQDYIEGEPMQNFISNGRRFQLGHIGGILLQLLDILQKLHQSDPQVVHRDIKPSNILLNYREDSSIPEVHLIDFGAVANPQVKGGGSTVVGTYGYMAPEQLMGRACAASDIYSLAIVAVYLLSGISPENLEIQDYHVLIDTPLQHLPYQITSFLRQMLEPRAEDRLADYDKIRAFCKALIDQKFDKIPCETQNKIVKHKYSLKKVYSYRQPGNIELWQALSDKTPRRLPMAAYASILKDALKIIAGFIIFIGLSIFVSFLYYHHVETRSFSVYQLLFILFNITIVLCICANLFIIISKLSKARRISHFLKNARKSMATVIRIEYVSYLNSQSLNKISTNRKYTPTWRITYSFNPPDDSSPDNLIRTVETHVEPDIKEGDLIPILYQIYNNKIDEHVYSTPYPIPVTDTLKQTEN